MGCTPWKSGSLDLQQCLMGSVLKRECVLCMLLLLLLLLLLLCVCVCVCVCLCVCVCVCVCGVCGVFVCVHHFSPIHHVVPGSLLDEALCCLAGVV